MEKIKNKQKEQSAGLKIAIYDEPYIVKICISLE
jgi:hypothetical protein